MGTRAGILTKFASLKFLAKYGMKTSCSLTIHVLLTTLIIILDKSLVTYHAIRL